MSIYVGNVSVWSTLAGQKLIGMWNNQSSAEMSKTNDEIIEVDVKMDDTEGPPNCDLRSFSNPFERNCMNGIEIVGDVTNLTESSDAIIFVLLFLRINWAVVTIKNGNLEGYIAWG